MKKRNLYIDYCKAIAIMLVVIGHCIQCGRGEDYSNQCFYYENPIFIFIYSFHMPLFMLVSGYLFSNTTKTKGYKLIIKNKIKQLIIPLLSWSIINTSIRLFSHLLNGKEVTFQWFINKIITNYINGPWFLWAIWWCSIAVVIVHKYFNNSPLIFIAGLLLTFVIPDSCNLHLYKYMYPYFVLAYYYGTFEIEKKYSKIINSYYSKLFIVMNFIVLLFFFNKDIYIYVSGYTLIGKNIFKQLVIDFYRFIIGLLGSMTVLYITFFFYRHSKDYIIKLFTYIGRNSIGVYIFSQYIFIYVLPRITSSNMFNNGVFVILEAIIVLMISLIVNFYIKKRSCLDKLFLGGR